jgi:hypothetical protein
MTREEAAQKTMFCVLCLSGEHTRDSHIDKLMGKKEEIVNLPDGALDN